MHTDQIRQGALSLWLRGVRIPLTVAEAALKRGQDTSDWGPTLAFAKVEAAAKSFVGNLVHDDTLIGLANLQRAEVTHREEALAKKAFVNFEGVTDEWIKNVDVPRLADGQIPPDQHLRLAAEIAAMSETYAIATCCAPAKKVQ